MHLSDVWAEYTPVLLFLFLNPIDSHLRRSLQFFGPSAAINFSSNRDRFRVEWHFTHLPAHINSLCHCAHNPCICQTARTLLSVCPFHCTDRHWLAARQNTLFSIQLTPMHSSFCTAYRHLSSFLSHTIICANFFFYLSRAYPEWLKKAVSLFVCTANRFPT